MTTRASNVLSKFGLHNTLGTSALYFIKLQFSLNQTYFFQNFHSYFMQLFLKDCITCFSELFMQSFSAIDLYRIAYEVCMNFKQSRHACQK